MNERRTIHEQWDTQRTLSLEKLTPYQNELHAKNPIGSLKALLSMGAQALCEVICFDHGQLTLRKDVIATQHNIWRCAILKEVSQKENIWFSLYQKGSFNEMRKRLFSSFDKEEWALFPQLFDSVFFHESLRMAHIPAGSFMMGALEGDTNATRIEYPRHLVTIPKPFFVGVFPCAQFLYQKIMGHNPSHFQGEGHPVEKVSWCDAILFCNKLSEHVGLKPAYILPRGFRNRIDFSRRVLWDRDANGFRLPTEAEWEYAARGGKEQLFSGSHDPQEVAWFNTSTTHPIGCKKENSYGLYDMSGNVLEWIWDTAQLDHWIFSGPSLYTKDAKNDPLVGIQSNIRHLRGGRWNYGSVLSRVSERNRSHATYRYNYIGFRLFRNAPS